MNILDAIANLKQGPTRYGPAPHKPILLLAVIEAFNQGVFTANQITLKPQLISIFENYWHQLVHTGNTLNLALPFFHLKNEKGYFWELKPKPGQLIPTTKSDSIKSFRALVQTLDYVQLSSELYQHMTDVLLRNQLKELILTTYFGNRGLAEYTDPYRDIQLQIAAEPDIDWIRKEEEQLKKITDPETKAYAVYVRNGYFSQAIHEIYNATCAISGMTCAGNISLVDACHIEPFSKSFNNSFRNGIALTPTLHHAFDHGLITISENYKVVVNPNLKENDASPYNLKQFQGKDITVAVINEKYLPAPEYLRYHRINCDF